MAFRLKPYLRNINDTLLTQYLKTKDLDYTPAAAESDKERAELILEFINKQGQQKSNEIESELSIPAELASEEGTVLMADFISIHRPQLLDNFGQVGGEHDRALWLYLEDPAFFQEILTFHRIENLPNKWIKNVRVTKDDPAELSQTADKLSEMVGAFFNSKESRGRQYHTDVFAYPDRTVFLVNLEDHIKTAQQFMNGKMVALPFKPTFTIHYVYFPQDKILEVSARGKADKIHNLANIFNEAVLGDEQPLDKDNKVYNLNKVLDPSFELVDDPADQIQELFLKRLVFRHKTNRLTRVTLEIEDGKLLETMLKEVKDRNMNLSQHNISEATFRIKFPGTRKTGSVTMTLTFPNRHNLTDKDTHVKAKKYIKKWGLEYEQGANQST